MLTNKTQAVLRMYDWLRQDSCLVKKDFLAEIELSDISFKRYVSELRSYFMNFEPELELVYSRKDDAYYLKKTVK